MALAAEDKNRAVELLMVTWIECTISMICVALRFYTRIKITRNVWYDDWVILFTMVLDLAFSSLSTAYAKAGGTRHIYYLDPHPAQKSLVLKLNWVSQAFCIFGFAGGKISVAILIYRLQGPSKKRTWFLIFCAVTALLVSVGLVYSLLGQCSPPSALWNPGTGKCWDPKKVNDFDVVGACRVPNTLEDKVTLTSNEHQTAYNALIDVALSLTPVTIVWHLQLSRVKKVLLSLLLGLGIFSGICAAIKTSYVPTLTARSDFTWITVDLLIWNANEVNVIIWAACCPVLRPLILQCAQKVKKRLPTHSGGSTRKHRFGFGRQSNSEHFKLDSIGAKHPEVGAENSETDETLHELEVLPLGSIRRTIDVDVKREQVLAEDQLEYKQYASALYATNIV